MVKTLLQAKQIQERRVKAGKTGYAKAVRRFFNREFPSVKDNDNRYGMNSVMFLKWY